MNFNSHLNLLITSWTVLALTIVTTAVIGLPAYLQILLTSLCTIHTGCSLTMEWAELRTTEKGKAHLSAEHQLKPSELAMFPIVASFMLVLLYVLLKLVNIEHINYVLYAYFAFAGVYAVSSSIHTVFERIVIFLDLKSWKHFQDFELLHIHFYNLEFLHGNLTITYCTVTWPTQKGNAEEETGSRASVTPLSVVCFFLAVVSIFWYHWTRVNKDENNSWFWLANNVQGIAFCIQGIQIFRTGKLRDLGLLLLAVFVYDIFWVFGTDVMVTIANKIDGPIKLLFPVGGTRPNLLGLGDLVLPGAFISMVLRFGQKKKGGMIYYLIALLAYELSLSATLAAMFYFDTAQPALLYLVPGLLFSCSILALMRGEFKVFWDYEEVPEESSSESVKKED